MMTWLLPFLFFLPLLLLLSGRWKKKPPLPPGPRQLPVIGNLNLLKDELMTHRGLDELSKCHGSGGLLYLRFGQLNTLTISTPAMAREVFLLHDVVFANRPASIAISYLSYNRADMAFAHYGPFWRKVRKLSVVKLFSRRRSESWASVRREVSATVLAVAEFSGRVAEVGELVFDLTRRITFSAAFGLRRSDNVRELLDIIQEFSKLFHAFNIGDFFPWLTWLDLGRMNGRLRKARLSLDRFIDKIIDDHIENPKDLNATDEDMVDEMLAFLEELPKHGRPCAAAVNDGDKLRNSLTLTRDNIKAVIMDVMFGGVETVASAIEWTMSELMRNPEEMKKVQSELEAVVGLHRRVEEGDVEQLIYLKCVIKENLRLHPPIPLPVHETAEECVLGGYTVPARTRVNFNLWAIGRDATAWKDAEVFRPSRFLPGIGDSAEVDFKGGFFEYIPFGAGRRSCPGMQLGLYAVELALAELLHCFSWKLPGTMKPSELSMDDVFGLTAPRAERLKSRANSRLSCPLVLHYDYC
ncbi:hypothetical protein HPP92_018965 [Vanilla planifolia]|uniref:Uncharacterized protein n=1 Tax=Vanilla planifolia TaxID=51239 RepID=A0A835UMH2_VANPL|nr:hypothetical protein HPP92_019525 [Vanilla planifolia]KAG0464801.1 hypothetical protein HPP92_018965 [Vanilla planifolia]